MNSMGVLHYFCLLHHLHIVIFIVADTDLSNCYRVGICFCDDDSD